MSNRRQLYEYARDVHKAEIEAFYATEGKAAQYFSAFGFLLSASGVTIGLSLNYFIPPHGWLKTILLLLSLLIGLCLLASAFFLFKVIRVGRLGIPSLDDEMITFFKSNNEDDIYEALSERMRDTTKDNRAVVKRKTKSLKRGYWCILVTTFLLACFGVVFIVDKWHTARP